MEHEQALRIDRCRDSSSQGDPGLAGWILAVASAATAVLSMLLLFAYVKGLSDGTDRLERNAQALLSHQSAVDLALSELSSRSGAEQTLPALSTGGLVSQCILSPDTASSAISFRIDLPGSTQIRFALSPDGVLAAGATPEGLLVAFHRMGSNRPEPGFPLLLPDFAALEGWTIAVLPGSERFVGVAVSPEEEGSVRVALIGDDGSAETSHLHPDSLTLRSGALLTTGLLDGAFAAVLTDGSHRAVLFRLDETEAPRTICSPPGTCPMFLPGGGGLFGEPCGGSDPGMERYTVTDVFTGDFNQDGQSDVAWAGPSSMACLLSGREEILLDSVDGSILTAWGFLEGRFGLGGLWQSPDGRLSWRKLLWSGFQQYPAGGVALAGYTGRIVSGGGTLAGVRDGRLEYAVSGTGSSDASAVSIEGGIPIDLDGVGAIDAAVVADGSIRLTTGPSGETSSTLRLTVTTATPAGEVLLTGVRTVRTGSTPPEAEA